MPKTEDNTVLNFDIVLRGLAKAISLYQEYLSKVSSPQFRLLEETIKYPLMEYLERRISRPVSINLEVDHPVFPSKEIDMKMDVDGVAYFFEFKYIRATQPSKIKQSFFNDVARLHFLVKHEPNCRCFFLVAGDPTSFKSALNPNRRDLDPFNMPPSNSPQPVSAPSFEWLIFDENTRGTYNEKTSSSEFRSFKKKYPEVRQMLAGKRKIEFQTLLKCYEGGPRQRVAIWEVF